MRAVTGSRTSRVILDAWFPAAGAPQPSIYRPADSLSGADRSEKIGLTTEPFRVCPRARDKGRQYCGLAPSGHDGGH